MQSDPMKKIRINELARQLEVPSHEILEMLPELGVSEKKPHSSSIDDDVADKIRRHYSGNGVAIAERSADHGERTAHEGNHRPVTLYAEREYDVDSEQEEQEPESQPRGSRDCSSSGSSASAGSPGPESPVLRPPSSTSVTGTSRADAGC